ncbi:hypothetical protein DPEC_G00348150 [Dallia pectoralis]|uniref:Uncharacterized protein n=1 Tax=Dallia pectoralis TaxID=75939 RepID=A0ACC2F4D0_DALPE|nr:hypothetical protein DPEC_G00348150 [Dallia pectoralis]
MARPTVTMSKQGWKNHLPKRSLPPKPLPPPSSTFLVPPCRTKELFTDERQVRATKWSSSRGWPSSSPLWIYCSPLVALYQPTARARLHRTCQLSAKSLNRQE